MTDPRPAPPTGYSWEAPTAPPVAGQPPTDQPFNPIGAPGASGPGAVGPASAPGAKPEKVRPWWGMGDALLMIPIMGVVLVVSLGIIAALAAIQGLSFTEFSSSDQADLPASMLVIPTLFQQLVWFGWPFIVSKWKGLGPAADWGWAFKPVDLGIGLGVAMIGVFSAGLVGMGVGALVGLEDDSLAENTQILTDLEGSPWLIGLLFVVVIGAPFSEELLFRGLIMRSVEKRWGPVAGVIGSLLVFVPIHFADGGIFSAGQIVLWSSIATLGAVLAIAALQTGRLAAPIVAHVIINGLASAAALGYFDAITDQLPS